MTSRPAVWFPAFTLLFAACPVLAQLPPSGTFSEAELPRFRAEIARIEKLLITAPDQCAVTYLMARTWAAAKQWPETMSWLRKAAEFRAGIDPSRDSVFAELRETREFTQVLVAVREATPPISRSAVAFHVSEGDLVPESIAYDRHGEQFYLGSMKKGKVLRCSASGSCTQFASGLGVVLGLKIQSDGLWLLNNSDRESDLIRYDVVSAREIRRYVVTGAGHNFNDLAIAPDGEIFLTDTRAGAVWHLARNAANLVRLPGQFESANGIALSSDGRLLYVSTFPDGITIVDLKTHIASPISRPPRLCLAMIDGLCFHRGALIAIQNGFMAPRVVRLMLGHDLREIGRVEVLERGNPLFDGVTTGVISGANFFYMANIQDDKKTGFNPIAVLKLGL